MAHARFDRAEVLSPGWAANCDALKLQSVDAHEEAKKVIASRDCQLKCTHPPTPVPLSSRCTSHNHTPPSPSHPGRHGLYVQANRIPQRYKFEGAGFIPRQTRLPGSTMFFLSFGHVTDAPFSTRASAIRLDLLRCVFYTAGARAIVRRFSQRSTPGTMPVRRHLGSSETMAETGIVPA